MKLDDSKSQGFSDESFEIAPPDVLSKIYDLISQLNKLRNRLHTWIDHSVTVGFIVSSAGEVLRLLAAVVDKFIQFVSAVTAVVNILAMTLVELVQIARGKIKEQVQTRLGASLAILALGAISIPMIVGAWAVAAWAVPAIFVAMGVVSVIKEHRIAKEIQQEIAVKAPLVRNQSIALQKKIIAYASDEKTPISAIFSEENKSAAKKYYTDKAEISELRIKMKGAQKRKKAVGLMIFGGLCLCLAPLCPALAIVGAVALFTYGIVNGVINKQEKADLKAVKANAIPADPLIQFIAEKRLTKVVDAAELREKQQAEKATAEKAQKAQEANAKKFTTDCTRQLKKHLSKSEEAISLNNVSLFRAPADHGKTPMDREIERGLRHVRMSSQSH